MCRHNTDLMATQILVQEHESLMQIFPIAAEGLFPDDIIAFLWRTSCNVTDASLTY